MFKTHKMFIEIEIIDIFTRNFCLAFSKNQMWQGDKIKHKVILYICYTENKRREYENS